MRKWIKKFSRYGSFRWFPLSSQANPIAFLFLICGRPQDLAESIGNYLVTEPSAEFKFANLMCPW